jgi:hypothetical protein
MKTFSKRRGSLVVAAVAACAFVLPSMASAASWAVVGSNHTFTSTNAGFFSAAITASCAQTTFTATVSTSQDMRITSASYNRCTSSGAIVGDCTKTMQPTNLPWRATPISSTNVQIDGVLIDVLLEQMPGQTNCNVAGIKLTLTGSLTGATYNNATRRLDLNFGPGIRMHSPLGNGTPLTPSGQFTDNQETLSIIP